MKNFLKIASLVFIASLFFASCTSKKQHCDAYGSISKVETNKNNIETQKSETKIFEKKS